MVDHIFKVAQIIGVVGAACLSGYIFCFSQAGVPTLAVAPAGVQCWQFKRMYNIGKSTSPLIAITVTLCNAYCAYHSSTLNDGFVSSFNLYLAAALCVPCIVPYTLLVMEPLVNKKLLSLGALVESGRKVDESSMEWRDLEVDFVRWRAMNFVRAAIVGTGAIFSAVATIVV